MTDPPDVAPGKNGAADPSTAPADDTTTGAATAGDAATAPHATSEPERRRLGGLAPQGPLQIAVGIAALCFLTGAIGYLLGTRPVAVEVSDVDRGFLIDMSTHHEQAVSMAQCTVSKATDQTVQNFAAEVMLFQSHELGTMETYLTLRGLERPPDDPDRPAMAWMGMGTTVSSMPGMATEGQIDALCSSTGPEVDRQFLTLMRAHHRGGIHMAEHAVAHTQSQNIRDLAGAMVRVQRSEVAEYTQALRRLGFE